MKYSYHEPVYPQKTVKLPGKLMRIKSWFEVNYWTAAHSVKSSTPKKHEVIV